MTEFLLFVVILMLLHIMDMLKKVKKEDGQVDKRFSYKSVLPDYKNKMCEITVKTPMPGIDVMFNIQGVLEDWDNQWVVMRINGKKKNSEKIFRIDNITSIKEIL